VLDCGGDEVLATAWLEGLGNPADCKVIAFGSATGEDHITRVRPNQRSNGRPGPVDDRFGSLPEVMDARRIPEFLP
jgi:hypothetical protein